MPECFRSEILCNYWVPNNADNPAIPPLELPKERPEGQDITLDEAVQQFHLAVLLVI